MTEAELVVEVSENGFATTMSRVRDAISGAGMKVFAEIDHGAAATAAGLVMPPTVLLLYGNAKAGTPIMIFSPGAALELPLRVLVSEGEDGRVRMSYHPIAPALERLGVKPDVASGLAHAQTVLHQAMRT